jgi:hypothetical protein
MYRSICFLIALGALGLAAPQADAAINLTVGDAYYVGLINDGIPPNPENEVEFINILIEQLANSGPAQIGTETYTRSSLAGPFDPAELDDAYKDDVAPLSGTLPGKYQYVLGKYDAAQGGTLVWYLEDGFQDVTLPGTYNGKGLSHISAYNRIGDREEGPLLPEPISIVVWGIGLGCFGAFSLRRRKR